MDDPEKPIRIIVLDTGVGHMADLLAHGRVHAVERLPDLIELLSIEHRPGPPPIHHLRPPEKDLDFLTTELDALIQALDGYSTLAVLPRPPTWTPNRARAARPPPPPPPIRSQRPRRRQP